jgi:hypothetical protein
VREARMLRERQVWIGTVAVLITSLLWLAAINAALITRGIDLGPLLVVARVLWRAGLGLVRAGGPLMLVSGILAIVLIGWLAADEGMREEPHA